MIYRVEGVIREHSLVNLGPLTLTSFPDSAVLLSTAPVLGLRVGGGKCWLNSYSTDFPPVEGRTIQAPRQRVLSDMSQGHCDQGDKELRANRRSKSKLGAC